MNKSTKILLVLFTPVIFILAHYLGMLPHEYAHSFMAWILGDKSNPLALNYGGNSWYNLLMLGNMDENVPVAPLFAAMKDFHVALMAFAGLGIANGSMYILTLWLLAKRSVKQRPFLYYLVFLWNIMNLGNFYDYVPMRTFTTHGDAANFEQGLHISPWWVYSIGGYIVAFLMCYFFKKTLPTAYKDLQMQSRLPKASLMIFSVVILFGFFGATGLYNHGEISYLLSATSLLAIPGLIYALWPKA